LQAVAYSAQCGFSRVSGWSILARYCPLRPLLPGSVAISVAIREVGLIGESYSAISVGGIPERPAPSRAPRATGRRRRRQERALLASLSWRLNWWHRNGVALDYRLLAAGKAFNPDGLVADVNDTQRLAATVRANEFHPTSLPVLERKDAPPGWGRGGASISFAEAQL